jgi:hypothetical protein
MHNSSKRGLWENLICLKIQGFATNGPVAREAAILPLIQTGTPLASKIFTDRQIGLL